MGLQFKQPFFVMENDNYMKHPVLQGGIDHFYSFSSKKELTEEILVPDGCVDIVFCCDDCSVVIAGSVTEAMRNVRRKDARFFGVRFAPGYFCGIGDLSIQDIKNDSVSLRDYVKNTAIFDEIIGCGDFSKQINLFLHAFQNEIIPLGIYQNDNILFQAILNRILHSGGQVTMDELAEELNYSHRRINGVFTDAMGIGVKQFCKIVRFQNLLEYFNYSYDQKKMGLADLAVELGYYDQAHMTREFKSFTLNSPKKYVTMLDNINYSSRIHLC